VILLNRVPAPVNPAGNRAGLGTPFLRGHGDQRSIEDSLAVLIGGYKLQRSEWRGRSDSVAVGCPDLGNDEASRRHCGAESAAGPDTKRVYSLLGYVGQEVLSGGI
jgi:hypothetical protein